MNRKSKAFFVAGVLIAGLAAFYFWPGNKKPALPEAAYWSSFSLAAPAVNSPWHGTFMVEEWNFTAPDKRMIEFKLFGGSAAETEWIYSDWLARTRSLTAFAVDPYFPGITKQGECAEEVIPKVAYEKPGSDIVFRAAAGKGYTPGACTKQQAAFILLRRIHVCEGASQVNVIDLFIPVGQAEEGALELVRALPCSTPEGNFP